MKIQCPCGAKYSFDITPEMARTPIVFICQECGQDSSELVNQLIRQQLGGTTEPTSAPPSARVRVTVPVVTPSAAPGTAGAGVVPQPPSGGQSLRVKAHTAPAASESAPVADAPLPCLNHPGQLAMHRCLVCQKPICPKCMALSGYVCSPLCKGKAEDQGIELPVYANQNAAAAAKQWRKVGRVAAAVAAMVMAVVGAWTWYAWFGSVPKPTFAIRFSEAAYSGQCRLCPQNQVVFLHGGTLARHDIKAGKEIWSQLLIDRKRMADGVAVTQEQMKIAREKAIAKGADPSDWKSPAPAEMVSRMEKQAAAALQLHVRGESVWVSLPGKLVRYDWNTGKPAQEIPVNLFSHRLVPNRDELLLIPIKDAGTPAVTHISLASGELRTEEFAPPTPARVAGGTPGKPASAASRSGATLTDRSGTPPGGQAGAKPLDPAAVANKAQNLTLAAKLALPAVLAANANQQRLLAEMRGQPQTATPGLMGAEAFQGSALLPAGNGFVQFSVKLLESKIVERQAMKAPPKKSALDGEVNAAATTAIANEILNEMQRERTGGVVRDDASRYQVTLRHPGAKAPAEWTGEVIGPPELFPLETVDVLVAGKSVLVFDKTSRKLWESKLNFNVTSGFRAGPSGADPPFGLGPCLERRDTLYVFDQGVLTAFELTSGNARWRLPSVGIAGLFFDDKGLAYVNTTTASPESIKYSRQIDISEKTRNVVLKIDPATGKTLWTAEQQGMVSYVSGKFVYTIETYEGDDDDDNPMAMKSGFETPPHIRIKRLDPGNGRVLWEHYQRRSPLDVQFEKTTIQLLFKKELQVLKFFSL